MDNEAGRVWGIAGAAGAVAFAVLYWLAEYGFWSALALAVLVLLLVAFLLWLLLYREQTEYVLTESPLASPEAARAEADRDTVLPGSREPEVPVPPVPEPLVTNVMPTAVPIIVTKTAPETTPPKPRESEVTTRVTLVASSGKADDLKQIKGVGPKIERLLHEMGVTSFAQIAAWTDADMGRVDDQLRFQGRIRRDRWVEQARALAAGVDTEFSKRVKEGDVY